MADESTRVVELCNQVRIELDKDLSKESGGVLKYDDLFGGVLLNRYLFLADPVEDYIKTAESYLSALILNAGRLSLYPLYGGVTGVGWLLNHLSNLDGDTVDVRDLNRVLIANLQRPWHNTYDLIGGLVGIGIFAVEKANCQESREVLERVVRRLDLITIEYKGVKTWFTPPDLLSDEQRMSSPNGFVNFGQAHGIPGVLRLLADAVRLDVEAERAKNLLEQNIPWLLDSLCSNSCGLCLQAHSESSFAPKRRLAWCYNELGGMVSVVAAGRVLGEPSWLDRAREVLDSTLGCGAAEAGVRDAGLCHGAAGIGHLYSWFGRQLGDQRYRDEADIWIHRIDDFRAEGFAGGIYLFKRDQVTFETSREESFAVLGGSVGVLLAMLCHYCGISRKWDTMLGLGEIGT